ncbi:MAG: hypothetical protein ACI81S_002127 [Sphingobacteriales bacterium]|jgi:hypothetical protein
MINLATILFIFFQSNAQSIDKSPINQHPKKEKESIRVVENLTLSKINLSNNEFDYRNKKFNHKSDSSARLIKFPKQKNEIRIGVLNDNFGDISNYLKLGDDLGETHSLNLNVKIPLKENKFLIFEISSTEFSKLNEDTPEPRDIFFTENNKLKVNYFDQKNSFYYSIGLGLNYIQGNKITFGATGQKLAIHKYFLNKYFKNRYWIYLKSKDERNLISFTEFNFGINKKILQFGKSSLNFTANMKLKLASNIHFSGLGPYGILNLNFQPKPKQIQLIKLQFKYSHVTNFINYKINYFQIGSIIDFGKIGFFTYVKRPINKYLNNPFIVHNDLDKLYINGILIKL